MPCFARADTLAVHYQRLYFGVAMVMYMLAVLALSVVAAQALFGWKPILALPEVAIMVVLLEIYLVGRAKDLNGRWLGYRSLAEAFRSGLFTALVGGRDRTVVGPSSEVSLDRLPWYQRAFTEAWRDAPAATDTRRSASELRELLIQGLIDHQIDYHEVGSAASGEAGLC